MKASAQCPDAFSFKPRMLTKFCMLFLVVIVVMLVYRVNFNPQAVNKDVSKDQHINLVSSTSLSTFYISFGVGQPACKS